MDAFIIIYFHYLFALARQSFFFFFLSSNIFMSFATSRALGFAFKWAFLGSSLFFGYLLTQCSHNDYIKNIKKKKNVC